MRFVPLILLSFVFAGCPGAPDAPTPDPAPSPTPEPMVAAPEISYEGAWVVADADGELFDILFFPNGQVVTNWAKGQAGPRGERGFWRRDGDRIVAFYDDGWTDILSPVDDGFVHHGYAPGTRLDGPPTNQSPANRVAPDREVLVGVWRVNEEPADHFTYIALRSDGCAFSTVNGVTEGTWEAVDQGFVCRWPDGWTDRFAPTEDGWTKTSWLGAADGEPADSAPAVRVGEAAFAVAP